MSRGTAPDSGGGSPSGGASDRDAVPSIVATEDGLRIDDPVERRQCSLRTATPPSPRRVSPERFRFPVDAAVAVETSGFTYQGIVAVHVRDGDGDVVTEVETFADETLPSGRYTVEFSAPVKVYVRVDAPLHITSGAFEMQFGFGDEAEVLVGARSYHERPAATVTTTSDPADVMDAVSALGSALKTTSPERSYPTLRGHPPAIELGETFDAASLSPPDTGVRIELPRDRAAVYVAAPLAYYLGATVVPGTEPRIVADGFERRLDGTDGFETAVERALKRTFFLDCVVRTEGLYGVDLHERRAVEPALPFDPSAAYDRPLADRLTAYFEPPYDALAPHVPEWKLTTHVDGRAETVETLPFVVDDLAVVRTDDATTAATAAASAPDGVAADDFTRSAAADTGEALAVVEPETTDSLEQAWIGDDAPLGASKPTVAAFRNRVARDAADGDIDIAVVCNDPEMAEEHAVADDVYGSRDDLPFDVGLHRELTTGELRAVLGADVDFFHYIGHIDGAGFRCEDGALDADGLDDVGVDAFLLNACRSYRQGMELIDAGAIGGVVTLADVIDSGAVRIGSAMARLLNRGFPLRAALSIARDRSIIGSKYIVVGDGNLDVTQAESLTPYMCEIETTGAGAYEVGIRAYPTAHAGMGTSFKPFFIGAGERFLNSGTIDTFELSREEVAEFLSAEPVPVTLDGRFSWSDEIDLDGA